MVVVVLSLRWFPKNQLQARYNMYSMVLLIVNQNKLFSLTGFIGCSRPRRI